MDDGWMLVVVDCGSAWSDQCMSCITDVAIDLAMPQQLMNTYSFKSTQQLVAFPGRRALTLIWIVLTIGASVDDWSYRECLIDLQSSFYYTRVCLLHIAFQAPAGTMLRYDVYFSGISK